MAGLSKNEYKPKIKKLQVEIILFVMLAKDAKSLFLQPLRGISSVGRALAWHARGQRFDPAILHKIKPLFVALFFSYHHLEVSFFFLLIFFTHFSASTA